MAFLKAGGGLQMRNTREANGIEIVRIRLRHCREEIQVSHLLLFISWPMISR